MIDITFAKKQILRMAQMFRFPKTSGALGELVEALMEASSPEMATEVVSGFLEEATSETPCPMGSEIRKAILRRLDDILPDPSCLDCRGVGDIIVLGKGGTSGSSKCHCWARRPRPEYHKWPNADVMGKELEELADAKRIK